MKTIGIIRKLDSLGRIVIPKEMRELLEINSEDAVEITQEADRIILKKYAPACIFCQRNGDVTEYKGKSVCKACLKELSDL